MRAAATSVLLGFMLVFSCSETSFAGVTPGDLKIPSEIHKLPAVKVLELMRPGIRKELSPRERRIFDQIKFSFPDNAHVLHVGAVHINGKRIVEISQGFLLFNHMLIESVFYDFALTPHKKLAAYMHFLSAKIETDSAEFDMGIAPLPRYPAYYVWAGVSDNDADVIFNRYRDRIVDGDTSVLVFAVLHETAHHLYGDVDSCDRRTIERDLLDKCGRARTGKELRDEEFKADTFAISTMKKMRLSAAPIVPWFLFQTIREGNVDKIDGNHDPSACRFALIMSAGATGPEAKVLEDLRAVCGRKTST